LGDDLDRLEQHLRAHADLRPLAAEDVLVQRLARPEAEPEAAREHRAQRRGGVGDHRGVIAPTRIGDRGPETERRPQPEGAHERPGERRLALLRRPRVEVLRDHEPGLEAGILGLGAPVEQVGRVELLEHCRVADLRHRTEWYECGRAGRWDAHGPAWHDALRWTSSCSTRPGSATARTCWRAGATPSSSIRSAMPG